LIVAKLDEEFFAAGKCESCEQEFFPEGHVKSNFLCNIGYGDPATLMPRGPWLACFRPPYPVNASALIARILVSGTLPLSRLIAG